MKIEKGVIGALLALVLPLMFLYAVMYSTNKNVAEAENAAIAK